MGKMVITDAGIAEVVNAEQTGTAPVTLTHIAFGTGQYTATAERTALQAEFKRFDAISGGGVGDNVFHVTMEDDSADAYTVYEVGVFTESGTLFAVYSQTTPIIQKSAGSIGMLAIDILLDEMNPESVTIGDTNFQFNPATTERKGVIEIATEAEAKAATDTERAITAATLQAVIQKHSNIVHRSGSETITGAKTFNAALTLGEFADIRRNSTDKYTYIFGGQTRDNGAYILVCGKDYGDGYFRMVANDGTTTATLQGNPDGTFKWNNKNIVRSVNNVNADSAGNVVITTISGNAGTATKLQTARTISLTGDVTGSATFDGSGNVSITATVADDSHNHIISNIDGLQSALNGKLSLSGGKMTGTIRSTIEGLIVGDTDTSSVRISGGTSWDNGASIVVCGKTHATYPGMFRIKAENGTNEAILLGKPDGTLTWGGKNIVRTVNGNNADANGNITPAQTGCLPLSGGTMTGSAIVRDVTDSGITLRGGQTYTTGATLCLYGCDNSTKPGYFHFIAHNGTNESYMMGYPDGNLTWNGKGITLGYPKYSAGVALGSVSTYTATGDGWIFAYARRDGAYWNLRVGGVRIFAAGGSDYDAGSCLIPVKKGDVIKTYAGYDETTTAYVVTMVFYTNR